MTEKKYMTASEYLTQEGYTISVNNKIETCYYKIESKTFKKLDAHFINKDLLKDKINKILNEFAKATDVDGRETLYKYTDCDLADLKEDLLEMLK